MSVVKDTRKLALLHSKNIKDKRPKKVVTLCRAGLKHKDHSKTRALLQRVSAVSPISLTPSRVSVERASFCSLESETCWLEDAGKINVKEDLQVVEHLLDNLY